MDSIGPREVLIAVGLLVLLAIILDGARRLKHHRYENLHMSSRKLQKNSRPDDDDDFIRDSEFPSGGSRVVGIRDDDDILQVEENLRRALAQKPDFGFSQPRQQQFDLIDTPPPALKPRPQAATAAKQEPVKKVEREPVQTPSQLQQILVMHLMAPKGEKLSGTDLQSVALKNGLRFGEMKIFQRHLQLDGSGEVLFSMANLVNPGTFDLKTIDQMTTPGVTFFMALDDLDDPAGALDIMIECVDSMAADLEAFILDETRSSMTRQTLDHYRQRARDVAFRRSREH
ncbi:MAG: cell division protein ZipA [Porticoccaceae bacterium]|jgi:cell division protein ZipA|nr:cell division protein ZipA [Alphaproteobacteria bacterium]MDP4743492.1 cell division protein ZipA [Porticoccaceae bacterium]MDP4752331.1 cell division protein ZipA [Porticoccaceae bacterium]MDP4890806.1 cell division protein ZipA [Porticoccaceae bacterium]MDP4987566.1 cell division protein ZipA [Porticoccaceae bacterium]